MQSGSPEVAAGAREDAICRHVLRPAAARRRGDRDAGPAAAAAQQRRAQRWPRHPPAQALAGVAPRAGADGSGILRAERIPN